MEVTAMGFTPIKKETLTTQIHDKILEMIIQNASEENLVLNEKRLVELFGVSKAPVREALIRLCSEGVLRSIPRYGYVVVQMGEKDAKDVLQTRVILELESMKLAFEDIVENHLEEIKEQIDKASVPRSDEMNVWDVWEDNQEFHTLLASYSGNQVLIRFLKECMGIQKRIYAQNSWNKRRSMCDRIDSEPHRGIYQALSEKNLEKTLDLLKKDVISVAEMN